MSTVLMWSASPSPVYLSIPLHKITFDLLTWVDNVTALGSRFMFSDAPSQSADTVRRVYTTQRTWGLCVRPPLIQPCVQSVWSVRKRFTGSCSVDHCVTLHKGLSVLAGALNTKIWTTVLRNSELVSSVMPQGFSAMRKTITITLTKVTPHLFKLARLASVGVCWHCSSYLYVCAAKGRWQRVSGLFALQECQYVIWM